MTHNKRDHIDTIDLGLIKTKLTMPNIKGGYNWPADGADEAILAYRDFLKTSFDYFADDNNSGDKPSPDPVVDIVWHTHILFTQKYHDDCDTIFGHYLHHEPLIEEEAPSA